MCKKRGKCFKIAMAILILLVLAIAGFVIWAYVGVYQPSDTAKSFCTRTDSVTAELNSKGWNTFKATNFNNATIGIVLYPGGKINIGAYCPLLYQIVNASISSNVTVFGVIVPMPLNLAFFGQYAADDVIKEYPSISKWIVGGHSLVTIYLLILFRGVLSLRIMRWLRRVIV
jgi:hypothetical protein